MQMGCTRIVGCVVAACAISALGATSAFATFENLPEWGKCEAKEGGVYSNNGCTKVAKPGAGKFEWHPLTSVVKFTSKKEKETGPAVLESQGGTKISCTGQLEKSGEYGPGPFEVKNVIGEFSGCEAIGFKCESEGEPEGLIHTKKLHGEPGVVEYVGTEEKNVDGSDLRGEETEFLAEFSCGGAPVKVRGGVVVKAQADSTGGTSGELTNKMLAKAEIEFIAESSGKQVPEEWTPDGKGITHSEHKKVNEHLESTISGGTYERGGQSLITDQESNPKTDKAELRQCANTIQC